MMYACMHVCIYIHTYIHIYIHKYTITHRDVRIMQLKLNTMLKLKQNSATPITVMIIRCAGESIRKVEPSLSTDRENYHERLCTTAGEAARRNNQQEIYSIINNV